MRLVKEIIRIGQLELHFLLDGEETDDNLVMFEFIIPAGAKVPIAHYHKDVDEVIYGLEGVTTTFVDGQKHETGVGDRLFIPRGAVHYHDNHSGAMAKTLCILTPSTIGIAYFREMSELIKPGMVPDAKVAGEIMLRHGLVPVVG